MTWRGPNAMPRSARAWPSWRPVQVRPSASDRRSSSATRSRRAESGGGTVQRVEGADAAGKEALEEVADGLAAMAEVVGDPGGGPAGVGEGEHLDAVTDLRRQGLAPQGAEFVASGVVEVDADHGGIKGKPGPGA